MNRNRGEVVKENKFEKIRTLIRLGQSIKVQRWKLGLEPEVLRAFERAGIRKEDIGKKLRS